MADKLAPEKRHIFLHNGQKVFEWDQTLDEVNIYINLPPNVNSKQFYCKIQSKHIELGIKGNPPFLNHDLTSPVKTDSSFWTLEDDIMHITLNKRDKGQTWASPILGQGQLDAYSTDLEQKRLMLQRFQEEYMAMDLSRITLRPFKLSDVDDFMLVVGDDRVTSYTRRKTFVSREQALCYIKDVCIPHPWTRSICIDNQTIGFISISPAGSGDDDDRCRAEIGYAIAANYWGQGICTKALKVAVSQVFKDIPDLVRIQAFVSVENQASQRVLEKVGFLREGILRKFSYVKGRVKDVAIFSLLSGDTHSLQ